MLLVLRRRQFKRYVNKLRTKSTTYKKKKVELSGLRAELGVLARTEEVLSQRHDVLDRKLVNASLIFAPFLQFHVRFFVPSELKLSHVLLLISKDM